MPFVLGKGFSQKKHKIFEFFSTGIFLNIKKCRTFGKIKKCRTVPKDLDPLLSSLSTLKNLVVKSVKNGLVTKSASLKKKQKTDNFSDVKFQYFD